MTALLHISRRMC